jgi:hypothetical protein
MSLQLFKTASASRNSSCSISPEIHLAPRDKDDDDDDDDDDDGDDGGDHHHQVPNPDNIRQAASG